MVEGAPSCIHYWADLQSVHGFRCNDNMYVYKLIAYAANAYSAESEMSARACCTRCVAGLTTAPADKRTYGYDTRSTNAGLCSITCGLHDPTRLPIFRFSFTFPCLTIAFHKRLQSNMSACGDPKLVGPWSAKQSQYSRIRPCA